MNESERARCSPGVPRITAFLLTFVMLAPGSAMAQGAPAPVPAKGCSAADAAALQGMIDRWKDGYNGGRASDAAALYREDAVYLTQHFAGGVVSGRANIQAYVQRGVDARYHIDSITILKMECAGALGYLIDRYESTNAGQKAMGVNLVVSRKEQGQWRIVAHEAAVPGPGAIQELVVH